MDNKQSQNFGEKRPWFSDIFQSKNFEELKHKYDNWANAYDEDLKEDWLFMPVAIAHKLSELLPDKNASILDAGAGTGFVGEALVQQGYTNLTAVDLSEEMLAIAKEKQVYQNLFQGNLEDSSIFSNSEQFDVIITAGVFAYAHAGVEALNNLFTFLKKGELFLLTIREDYRQEMQTALDQLSWQLISEEAFPIYDEAKLMYLLAFKKEIS